MKDSNLDKLAQLVYDFITNKDDYHYNPINKQYNYYHNIIFDELDNSGSYPFYDSFSMSLLQSLKDKYSISINLNAEPLDINNSRFLSFHDTWTAWDSFYEISRRLDRIS